MLQWLRELSLPNQITLLRLVGLPFVVWGLQPAPPFSRWLTLILFVAIALTDWLDGYLARRLNQITDLGKFLDPLADKLLVLIPLLSLIELGRIAAWGVALILTRELVIAGWRVQQTTVTGANYLGKVKTVVQLVAIALLIAPIAGIWLLLGHVLFWISVVLTLVSGGVYFRSAVH
ncbi:MAG: CDP-diacylglycerol--glycerol-3-phosphate 3-phosphatidyltransferase [Cyanobacteria bacterium P01_H01_bin.121]